MKVHASQGRYVLVLERGERVIESIRALAEAQGIQGAVFQGIGAIADAEVGYYDLPKREYFFKTFKEDREVASMQGNIALVEGKPFIHAHVVLSASDDTLACVGGHLKEARVAVTLEIVISDLKAPLSRKMNDDIGLKLLDV